MVDLSFSALGFAVLAALAAAAVLSILKRLFGNLKPSREDDLRGSWWFYYLSLASGLPRIGRLRLRSIPRFSLKPVACLQQASLTDRGEFLPLLSEMKKGSYEIARDWLEIIISYRGDEPGIRLIARCPRVGDLRRFNEFACLGLSFDSDDSRPIAFAALISRQPLEPGDVATRLSQFEPLVLDRRLTNNAELAGERILADEPN